VFEAYGALPHVFGLLVSAGREGLGFRGSVSDGIGVASGLFRVRAVFGAVWLPYPADLAGDVGYTSMSGFADVEVANVPASSGNCVVVEGVMGVGSCDDVGADVLAERAPNLHRDAVTCHEVRPEGEAPSL
jgi:hypothetical protein